jgi:hypothetical protein
MRFGLDLPSEDELAIAIATFRSEYLSCVFPSRAAHYDRYVTLRGLADDEVQRWKDGLLWFARKLTWKYGKPLVLKSPLHTGRIKLLLDLFPDARFVHIHRDPYAVFPSARHTLLEILRFSSLQRPQFDLDERTIRLYQEVADAFFDEKRLIRADRFCEVRFDDLERDPIGQMRRIYEVLKLPDFHVVEPAMQRYLATLRDYTKNKYSPLAPEVRQRIAREWTRSFEAWGYPL